MKKTILNVKQALCALMMAAVVLAGCIKEEDTPNVVDPNLVTVTFHANGGSGSMGAQVFTKEQEQKLNKNTFTAPAGKAFAGWSTQADGTGSYLLSDEEDTEFRKNTDLYAQWTEAFTITFKANGGTGDDYTQIVAKGEYVKLDANRFTAPENKGFVDWNTKADGTEKSYFDEAEYCLFTESVILYAQWGEYLTITFNANGGTGADYTQKFVKGAPVKLDANKFTHPDGKGFKYWKESQDGPFGPEHLDESVWIFSDPTTLYAQWTEAVTIAFDVNGGGGAMSK
ncbi:MAG: InlB B-repeat-containing protein [Bacteroidales bacterium]